MAVVLDLLIGREGSEDKNNSVLKIATTDGKMVRHAGAPGRVPQSVSRTHLQLTIHDDDTCEAKNVSKANVLYANGLEVRNMRIKVGDRLELGADRYPVDWNLIKSMMPKKASIAILQGVWDQYQQRTAEIKRRKVKIGLLCRVPMALSMLGGVLSAVLPEDMRPVALAFTVIALIIMCYGFWLSYNDPTDREMQELQNWVQNTYVCPSCGQFLGNTPYNVLSKRPACPYCKVKFVP